MRGLNYRVFVLCIGVLILPGVAMAQELLTWKDCVNEALNNHPDLIAAKEKIKHVKADKDIVYGTVVQVMAAIRGAGVEKVGMVTTPADIETQDGQAKAKSG